MLPPHRPTGKYRSAIYRDPSSTHRVATRVPDAEGNYSLIPTSEKPVYHVVRSIVRLTGNGTVPGTPNTRRDAALLSSKNQQATGGWFSRIAPGILIAATGVGAGDLLMATLAGSQLGLAILWAAVLGAFLKWFLNEGIARWQMATDTTLLEGWFDHLGRWIRWVFLGYLLIWSFFVAGALINACGVAGSGLLRITDDPRTSKAIWGVLHALVGLVLVLKGGYALFARVMSVCIGVMFVTVIATAVLSGPDWSAVAHGALVPTLPEGGISLVLGVLGGVGGTVTLLSYGYWIREERRSGAAGLKACRIDLGLGYVMTALFGVAMIIIGSRLDLSKGPDGLATVAIDLANQLGSVVGVWGKWAFLIGFWGAVFSSLLGVWQSVPYLFADFWALRRRSSTVGQTPHQYPERERRAPIDTGLLQRADDEAAALISIDLSRTRAYRIYLFAIAIVPLPLLLLSVRQAQLIYAVLGSFFMPLLALTLLLMNNRTRWVGKRFRNGIAANVVLVATLGLFAYLAISKGLDYLWAVAG